MSLAERLYALLLQAYPVDYRTEFGPEMRQAFHALDRDFRAQGLLRYARFVLSEATGALYHALRERARRALGKGAGRAPKGPLRPQRQGVLRGLAQDFRHATRTLTRNRAFTATAVVTIALGIGASVTVYSVVRAVLMEPLPYRDADRIVHVWSRTNWAPRVIGASRDMADYRAWTTLFEGFASKSILPGNSTITVEGRAENVRTEAVTPNFFSLLGADAMIGRTFLPSDVDRPAPGETPPPMAVVISYGLWQRALGADPAAVGRTIELYGWPVRVIGVMPRSFAIFNASERARDRGAELWMPQDRDPSRARYGLRNQLIIGRLRPGVSLAQAQAEMDAVAARLREAVGEYERSNLEIVLEPALHDVVKGVDGPLTVLFGAVGFLLLLSCANVANLLLIRGRTRAVGIAVRSALGCRRARMVRQMMMESVLLSLLGGLVGIGLTGAGIRILRVLRPPEVPRVDGVELNVAVLAFALFVSLASAILFGLLPALRASRLNLVEVMKGQAGGTTGRTGEVVLGGSVVVGVSLTMVLLVGAGLMLRTFSGLQSIEPGFDPEGVLTFGLNLYRPAYQEPSSRGPAVRDLETRIAAIPGVEAVGSNLVIPIVGGGLWNGNWAWDEESEARFDEVARFRMATPDYFKAMGIRLVSGRFFTEAEMVEPSNVAIVDRALADRAWPGESAIGKTVIATDERLRVDVIGVVETVRFRELKGRLLATVYFPYGSHPDPRLRIAVRTGGAPADFVGSIRSVVEEFDPDLAMFDVAPLDAALARSLAPTRFLLVLMEIFAGIATILAIVGLYGVVSFAVRSRREEIGIRVALGAQRLNILRMVFGRGVRLIGLGIVLGTGGAMALSRFLASMLYGVAPTDPVTLIGAAVILGCASAVACWVPAWRGAGTDAMVTLRST